MPTALLEREAPPTRQLVAVYLYPDEVAQLDKLAERHGLSRSETARQLIELGLDAYRRDREAREAE